jgi:RNA polymerase-binding transcription factor DksA
MEWEWFINQSLKGEYSSSIYGTIHSEMLQSIQRNVSIALHIGSRMCTATKGYALRSVSSSTYGCNQSGMPIDQIASVKPEFLICGSGSPQELLHL